MLAPAVVLGLAAPAASWAQADRQGSEDPQPRAARVAAQRLAVQWEDITASEALADLATRLGEPIWTSDGARDQARRTRVRLLARDLTGFQALNVLCRLAGLQWTYMDGLVAVTDTVRTPSTWRMSSDALRSRLLAERPELAQTRVGAGLADLDLVDATVSAAVARLGEAYGLNLWVPEHVRRGQQLVTLQGEALPVAEAVEALAGQLRMRVAEADGVVWLLPDEWVGAFITSRPVSAPSGAPATRSAPARRWTVVRTGMVRAEGWAADIEAVRRWRVEYRDQTREKAGPAAGAAER